MNGTIIKIVNSQFIIARMTARMSEIQKLKQKSQSNNLDISIGALSTIRSRIPNFSNSIIVKDAIHAITTAYIKTVSIIIYIVDIIPLLL